MVLPLATLQHVTYQNLVAHNLFHQVVREVHLRRILFIPLYSPTQLPTSPPIGPLQLAPLLLPVVSLFLRLTTAMVVSLPHSPHTLDTRTCQASETLGNRQAALWSCMRAPKEI